MLYSIRRIKDTPVDEEKAEEIRDLHLLTFGDKIDAQFDPEKAGDWWFAYCHDDTGEKVAAFAGLCPSIIMPGYAFLMRSGVLPEHRGHGLQLRLIRVRERWARRCGYKGLVSYTVENPQSANNIIKAGLLTYEPPIAFACAEAVYFKKDF